MKTSILMSSFAALCLMITFAESPSRRTIHNNNAVTSNEISYITVYSKNMSNTDKIIACSENTAVDKRTVVETNDLSYLKFNVSDYVTPETNDEFEIAPSNTADNKNLDYLKFDILNYKINTDEITFELPEMSLNDFGYLKFNINSFTNGDDNDLNKITDLPSDEFSYLKFKANKFSGNSADIKTLDELPSNN